jgi:hypothetical protein
MYGDKPSNDAEAADKAAANGARVKARILRWMRRSFESRGGQSGFFDRGISISRTSEKTSVEWSDNALSRPAKFVGDQKDGTKRFKYVEFREAQLVPR